MNMERNYAMKRLIGFIVILALLAVACCSYYFNWFGDVGFFKMIYTNLTDFGGYLAKNISFLNKLDHKLITLIFISLCAVVFFALYFLIFGLIAHAKKKKLKEKKEKEKLEANKNEEKNNSNSPLMNNISGLPPQLNNPGIYQKTYQTYQSSGAVSEQLSEEELDEEFHWSKFVGGKKVVRTIVSIILGIAGLIFLFLRFVWQLKLPNGNSGIGFLDPLFQAQWFKSMMGWLDSISNDFLRQFMPSPTDPAKNFVVGNVLNGQHFYLQDLFEVLIIIFAIFIIIMIYLLITYWLCYLCRKPNAKKRAAKAKEKYLEDLANGTAPSIRRKNEGGGNTYITYFGQVSQYGQPLPSQAEQVGNVESAINDTEQEFISPTKAELLIGGSNFIGGDVTKIAALDPLDESGAQTDDAITYIESLAEGVHEVEEEKPYEEYEEYESVSEEQQEEETIEEVEEQEEKEEFKLDGIFIDRIFASSSSEEDVDTEMINELIDFDEDGFAYRLEVNGEMNINESSEDDLPGSNELTLAGDDSALLDHIDELTLIEEPDFELINKVSLMQPEFIVANGAGQLYYPNLDDEVSEEVNHQDGSVFGEFEQEVIDRYVERNKPDDLVASEEQEELLRRIDPTPLVPVESSEWPREDTMIDDVGALRIYLDEGEKSVEFDRTRKPNYLAPEIYELEDEEAVEEIEEVKEDDSKKIKPLHDIRERKKISPIFVAKKEEVVEEKEIKPLAGPLHEITERSQKKDIKPVEINSNLRFNLKRFTTSTYHGNLTSQQAFELGVTKVSPVVNPVAKGAASDSSVPDWMKKIKEREAKKQGVDSVKIKQAEDIGSVWDINTKEEVVKTVNDFSLRRKKKVEVEEAPVVETENTIVVLKPKAPIKPVEIKRDEDKAKEEEQVEVKPVATPLKPIHKINRPTPGVKPTGIKPVAIKKPAKPLAPVSKKDEESK